MTDFFTKKLTVLLPLLLLLFSNLLFFSLSSFELSFDEAAAWYVSESSSFSDLVLGRYTHVGDVPIVYIFYKLVFTLFGNNELLLRIVPVFFSFGSIVVFSKILDHSFENDKLGKTLLLIAVSLSPTFIFYSGEFKSYGPGLFFQLLFLLTLVRARGGEKNNLHIISIVCSLALFSSFSSFFLVVSVIAFYLTRYLFYKEEQDILLLKHILVPLLCFVVWLVGYFNSSFGQLGIKNYASLGDRDIVGSVRNLLSDSLWLDISWGGTYDLNVTDTALFFLGKATGFLLMLFSLVIAIRSIHSSKERRWSLLYLSLFMLSLSFSIFFFNVLKIRFNLLLIFFLLYFLFKNKSTILRLGFLLCTVLLWLLFMYRTSLYDKYSYSKFASVIGAYEEKERCLNIVVSHEVGFDAVRYYLDSGKVLERPEAKLLNYNSKNAITTFETQKKQFLGENCTLFLVRAYDVYIVDKVKNGTYFNEYTEVGSLVYDTSTSLHIYEK